MGKQTVAVQGSGGLPYRGAGPAGRSTAATTAATAGSAGPTSPAGDTASTDPASYPAPPAAARFVSTGTTTLWC